MVAKKYDEKVFENFSSFVEIPHLSACIIYLNTICYCLSWKESFVLFFQVQCILMCRTWMFFPISGSFWNTAYNALESDRSYKWRKSVCSYKMFNILQYSTCTIEVKFACVRIDRFFVRYCWIRFFFLIDDVVQTKFSTIK